MILVDTSVWVLVLRDSGGKYPNTLRGYEDGHEFVFTRFCQLELLQAARDEQEWSLLAEYLADQEYLETFPDIWKKAARLYFDLRRRGKTVRSPIDCCIAPIALDNDVILLHQDKDFQVISSISPLREQCF